jgi:hypothetical protein
MYLAESLRSPRCLAATKHLEPSLDAGSRVRMMLVVAFDSLLHGFPGEVLDFQEYYGQSRRIRSRFIGGHRVRVTPVFWRAERKKAAAASVSRCSRNSTSTTYPYSSRAR